MFGIPIEYEHEIAHMEGSHSWAVFYMTGERHRSLERSLSDWIEHIVSDYSVWEIIRNVLFLYLEHRAIVALFDRHARMYPGFEPFLPVIDSPYQAALYGKQFLYYDVNNRYLQEASDVMENMFKGRITPLGIVQIPFPGLAGRYVNPKDPFFPVGMRPMFWGNCDENDFGQYVPSRFYGIVDLERGYTFSTVTWKYCLYTNKQVYELMLEIAGTVLGNLEETNILDDFVLSKTRGSCRMIVKRAVEVFQPLINDGWQAVLVGVNSYDTTSPLRYTFGFKNVAYQSSFLMDEYTVSIQTAHIIPFEAFREKVLAEINANYEFKQIDAEFKSIIQGLKDTKMAEMDMMPLFCKYFRITRIPESDQGKNTLQDHLGFVSKRIRENLNRFGKNAYTMLHVIMDYISWYNKKLVYEDQIAFGKWVKEFLSVSKASGFSISRYIGSDAYDVASWFGKL